MPRRKSSEPIEPVLKALISYRKTAGVAQYTSLLENELQREALTKSIEDESAETSDHDVLLNAMLFYAEAGNYARANGKASEIARDGGNIARCALDAIGLGHLYEDTEDEG